MASTGLHRRRLPWFAIVLGLAAGISGSACLMMLDAMTKRNGPVSRWWPFAFIAVCVLTYVLRIWADTIVASEAQKTMLEMRRHIAAHTLRLPLSVQERAGEHRILNALVDDVATVAAPIIALPQVTGSVIIVVASMSYLAHRSFELAVWTIGTMCVGLAATMYFVKCARRTMVAARARRDDLLRHFQSLVRGAKELKLNRRRSQAFLRDCIEATMQSMAVETVRTATMFSAARSCSYALLLMLMGLSLFAAHAGGGGGDGAGSVLILSFLVAPVSSIVAFVPELARARVAADNLNGLGISIATGDAASEPAAMELAPGWARIELVDVTHSFKNDRGKSEFTLGPVRLSIAAGELVFVTGGNGSGKTTLSKIIAGLYTPESGHVSIDGQTVTAWNLDAYRQNVSAVFFDFHLFDRLLGLDAEVADGRLEHYVGVLGLASKVSFDGTSMSSTELSQGQRRRLALLSLILENRSLCIFDEWASDQDTYFREYFYERLLRDLRSSRRTAIVITHDDRYFHLADRIVRLERGAIVSIDDGVMQRAHRATDRGRV